MNNDLARYEQIWCFGRFDVFLAIAERQERSKLEFLQPHGGVEYISEKFTFWLITGGNVRRCFSTYTHLLNGVAYRMYCTVLSTARALSNQEFVWNEFWAKAAASATYIRDKITYAEISANKSPFEMWIGRKPDPDLLRVFRSACSYHTRIKL